MGEFMARQAGVRPLAYFLRTAWSTEGQQRPVGSASLLRRTIRLLAFHRDYKPAPVTITTETETMHVILGANGLPLDAEPQLVLP